MKYSDFIPVFSSNKNKFSKEKCKSQNYSVLLITGIANPKPLIDYLNEYSKEVIHLRYNDHHKFTTKNIKEINHRFEQIKDTNKVLITTEKDAMRLRDISRKNLPDISTLEHNFYYLPIEVDFLNQEDKEQFNKKIIDYVSKN